jgi:hypothetical protein
MSISSHCASHPTVLGIAFSDVKKAAEEAIAKLEELVSLGELEDLFSDGGEIIAESIVEQLPSDNEGRPTFAIFDEENTIVYENATLY